MIPDDVARYIESSVLCWLATVSADGIPNVSPKEAFLLDENGRILVADIASPRTTLNIRENNKVCLSFVNIFVQKGYKVRGEAKIMAEGDVGHADALAKLTSFIGEAFKIVSIIEIDPVEIDPIIAPSYRVFPASTESDRIRESLDTYKVAYYEDRARSRE